MVGVMRRAVRGLCMVAVTAMMAATALAQDVTGAWDGLGALDEDGQNFDPEWSDYFIANLTEQDGRISGNGVINLCPRCRGIEEYAVSWVGERTGDRLVLHGIHLERWSETPVVFMGRISADGARVEGELTNKRNEFRQNWVMLRERNGAVTEEAPAESR